MPVTKSFIMPPNFKRKVMDLLEEEHLEKSDGKVKMTKLHEIYMDVTSRSVRVRIVETV